MKAVHAIAAGSSSWQTPSATRGRAARSRNRRAGAAADPQSDQEHGQDDREGVDRGAEHQRQQPRPDDFGAERVQAGERDGDVDASTRRRALLDRSDPGPALVLHVRCHGRQPRGQRSAIRTATLIGDGDVGRRTPCRGRAAGRIRPAGTRTPRRRCCRHRRTRARRCPRAWSRSSARWPGSDAPISSVGGSRQIAHSEPAQENARPVRGRRSPRRGRRRTASATQHQQSPSTPMPSSS